MAGTWAVMGRNEGGDPRVFVPSPRARSEPGGARELARHQPG
jgi:hypothetical protein